ncbi:MAG: NUDIX hydrolase [Patescibacteria group bacterium]
MSTIPNNYYRTSIKALILDEHKRFLLFKEYNGFWELPGGGLDFGEKVRDCLIREMKEEAGLEVTEVNPRPSYFITVINNNNVWKSMVIYETKIRNLNFKVSDECIEIRFFTIEEARQEKLYFATEAFLKEYSPDNH